VLPLFRHDHRRASVARHTASPHRTVVVIQRWTAAHAGRAARNTAMDPAIMAITALTPALTAVWVRPERERLDENAAVIGADELRQQRHVHEGDLGVQQVGDKPHHEQAPRPVRRQRANPERRPSAPLAAIHSGYIVARSCERSRNGCFRGKRQSFRPNEIAELGHGDASKRQSRRVIAQSDPLQCAEGVARCECMRCRSDQRVHRNPAKLVTPVASTSGVRSVRDQQHGTENRICLTFCIRSVLSGSTRVILRNSAAT
jgi:hypothetical protein